MNLASVLHYLQSEWRRWERDRNEWEIERAEMRVSLRKRRGQGRKGRCIIALSLRARSSFTLSNLQYDPGLTPRLV
jgi:hypothetical protein